MVFRWREVPSDVLKEKPEGRQILDALDILAQASVVTSDPGLGFTISFTEISGETLDFAW